MNWIQLLGELIPVLGGVTGHPELVALAEKLVQIGEEEVARRMADSGQTREQVLADASATWDAAIKGADDLANQT